MLLAAIFRADKDHDTDALDAIIRFLYRTGIHSPTFPPTHFLTRVFNHILTHLSSLPLTHSLTHLLRLAPDKQSDLDVCKVAQ